MTVFWMRYGGHYFLKLKKDIMLILAKPVCKPKLATTEVPWLNPEVHPQVA